MHFISFSSVALTRHRGVDGSLPHNLRNVYSIFSLGITRRVVVYTYMYEIYIYHNDPLLSLLTHPHCHGSTYPNVHAYVPLFLLIPPRPLTLFHFVLALCRTRHTEFSTGLIAHSWIIPTYSYIHADVTCRIAHAFHSTQYI